MYITTKINTNLIAVICATGFSLRSIDYKNISFNRKNKLEAQYLWSKYTDVPPPLPPSL
jgi:hypothetical protein